MLLGQHQPSSFKPSSPNFGISSLEASSQDCLESGGPAQGTVESGGGSFPRQLSPLGAHLHFGPRVAGPSGCVSLRPMDQRGGRGHWEGLLPLETAQSVLCSVSG